MYYSSFYVEKSFYQSLQPRVSISLLLNDKLSVKAGYAYMNQYIHMLSNSNLALPTDLWVSSTKRIVPMQGHQLSMGAFYNLFDLFDLSIEGYYKSMNNLLEYRDGSSFLSFSSAWEDKVSLGRGWSYGVEFLAQKTVGKTTGWVAYTWSRAERLFDRKGEEINFGKVFPAKYDRRHDISIVLSHKLSDKIDLSATWVFNTGNTATLALQNYYSPTVLSQSNSERVELPHISHRNNFRYPAYHRLDLGINFYKYKKKGLRTWNISVYNAYNNMNPFLVHKSKNEGISVLKKRTIFTFLPSVSYSYKF